MIVGFDIGANSALAVLDLDKKVKLLVTFRGGLKEAIKILREREIKPVVIAVDKTKLEAGSKLASAFGAVLFTPEHDLKIKEKRELVKGYTYASDHERDALAAALLAYKHYYKLILKVRKKQWEIFEKIIKKEAPNIAKAMEEEKKGEKIVLVRAEEREIQKLRKRVRELEERVKILKEKLEFAKSEAFRKVLKEKEVERLKEMLKKREELDRALASRIIRIIKDYKQRYKHEEK